MPQCYDHQRGCQMCNCRQKSIWIGFCKRPVCCRATSVAHKLEPNINASSLLLYPTFDWQTEFNSVQEIGSPTAPGSRTISVPSPCVWLWIEAVKLPNVSWILSLNRIIIVRILRSSLHLSSTFWALLALWFTLCGGRAAGWAALLGILNQLSVWTVRFATFIVKEITDRRCVAIM